MPTPQTVELHHSAGARFQSGNRVYRIVILGQGGVGKSGECQPYRTAAWSAAADIIVPVCVLRACIHGYNEHPNRSHTFSV